MQKINELLEPYAELEGAVRQLMAQLFSDACGMCTACCCRADICEEATSSAFLSLLLERQGVKAADMDDRYGWLDLHGCSLEYGRPPICYIYFCDQLLSRLPDDETRYASTMLGKLMNHVGHQALGGWHLVEIMDPADLEKVDVDGLFQRLEEAQAAFEVIEEFCQTGRLSRSARETLSAITSDED
ncbi:hypothetical protein [Pontiella sulfatireligans]|uniref:Uncharacterized protein n=1 Tax=Pontiella sulfatireligans TaxID=2750658 RepID=A0A6C2UN17_9BACT|nr:hypothetical protein [Pontiella sulfatireligans]VGO20714.1 hypothetical protein SCARR_02781 [Pontiella sulfatireligans]